MYNCPACGATEVAGRETCACGADLGLLARLEAVSDAWFNEGLRALSEGARGRALEWFSAACAARPTDAAARRAQAKVWAQLGRWDEAREALERAALIEPDADELNAVRQAIEDAASLGQSQKADSKESEDTLVVLSQSASGSGQAKKKRIHKRMSRPRR